VFFVQALGRLKGPAGGVSVAAVRLALEAREVEGRRGALLGSLALLDGDAFLAGDLGLYTCYRH